MEKVKSLGVWEVTWFPTLIELVFYTIVATSLSYRDVIEVVFNASKHVFLIRQGDKSPNRVLSHPLVPSIVAGYRSTYQSIHLFVMPFFLFIFYRHFVVLPCLSVWSQKCSLHTLQIQVARYCFVVFNYLSWLGVAVGVCLALARGLTWVGDSVIVSNRVSIDMWYRLLYFALVIRWQYY